MTYKYEYAAWDAAEQANKARDCEHGALVRACLICELQADLAAERARADTWENEAERRSRRYEQCAVERDRLRAAALKLANEADALETFEDSIRHVIGDTNYNVLRLRVEQMRAALAEGEAK